ncbi:MBL fold metallo-hydrolase [Micromonospora sp. CPCC 205371]|nr:MBL fold metallo-hydrolase [Micromonospora sp. CPCC 205371]
MRRRLAVATAGLLAIGLLAMPSPSQGMPRSPGDKATAVVGFVIGEPTLRTRGGGAQVAVPVLTGRQRTWAVTEVVPAAVAETIQNSVAPGALVDYRVSHRDVVVPADPSATFHTVLTKGRTPVFDMKEYGPELAPRDGRPGDLVAAGWIYDKRQGQITLGDGREVTHDISGRALPKPIKRYEETHQVDRDVEVYEVDTADLTRSRPSSFDQIPVTNDYDYATTERQAAFVVFDRDHRQADSAKVRTIYYFTPRDISDGLPVWDVPTQSSLLNDKGIDPVSGRPYADIQATGVSQAPYTRSTEPFEIVKDTLFYVGDNEVALYLINADMGTSRKSDDRLVLVDTGWPNSGYQYWKNVERMGFDPRQITDVLLSHAHLDHYGTTRELVTMIENAGGDVTLHASREDIEGIKHDGLGNAWNIPPALPATEKLLRERARYYEYDKFIDLGNVRIMPVPTPGHTVGTTSFVFDVDDPDGARRVTFGFMGGYGFNGMERVTATNGFRRLNFQLGLAWLQQRVHVEYVAPSHTNQYPLVEVYQALKAHNNDPANRRRPLDMLDALTTGEFVNFNQKRYAVATHALSDTQPNYQSIETYGPFKPGRENGARDVAVTLLDAGKVIRGYDKHMNVNPKIPLLADGIVIERDSYVHDPDGYYVQFYADVHDSYEGFLPGSGPVESYRPTPGAPEILRTQRFHSRAQAEAVLASVAAGATYRVDLTPASAIVVPADGPVFEAIS